MVEVEFRSEGETDNLIHGRRFERADDSQPWREVMGKDNGGCSIPKYSTWFEGSPSQLLERCGISCTDVKRASDLTNLFDGDLSGFYYVEAASPPGSEEAIIWILGGLAAHINLLNQDRQNRAKLTWQDFPRILPADYLRAFCEAKIANSFPTNFAKDIFAELLAAERFGNLSTKGDQNFYWTIDDDSELIEVADLSWEEFEAHVDAGREPVVMNAVHRPLWRRHGDHVVKEIINDPRFKEVDENEIDGIIDQVLVDNPKEVEAAKANPRAVNALIGKVMKASKGKASPQAVQEKLKARFAL